MPRLWPLAALSLALAACDAAPVVSACVPGVDPSCEGPAPPDDVVAGVDLRALFAVPGADEVTAALAAAPGPTAGRLALTALPDGPDGARRFVLALDGDDGRVASALVRVPGPAGVTDPLPVVVVLPDGTDGASEADLLLAPGYGGLPDRAVQVVVAYRGETLATAAGPVASALAPAPYRADVADLRALLGGLAPIPRADPGRVALVGFGRGGTVALLGGAGTRAVVTLGAPADLFAASFVAEVRTLLLGSAPPAPFPAVEALAAPALALRDGAATLAEARVALAALSPARLRPADRLAPVLALHGDADEVVGVDQLQSLGAALPAGSVAVLVEGETHASLPAAPAVQNQVASFLLNRL